MDEESEPEGVQVRLTVDLVVSRGHAWSERGQRAAADMFASIVADQLRPYQESGLLLALLVTPSRGAVTAGEALEQARTTPLDGTAVSEAAWAAPEPQETPEDDAEAHEDNDVRGVAAQALEQFGRHMASLAAHLARTDGVESTLEQAVRALGTAVGALAVLHPFEIGGE